jgi:hypothetical protein
MHHGRWAAGKREGAPWLDLAAPQEEGANRRPMLIHRAFAFRDG